MNEIKQLTEDLKTIGLSDEFQVRFLPVDQLCFNPEFRRFCEQDTCNSYNKNYGCPPDAGTAETLIQTVKQYQTALIYQLSRTYTDLPNPVYQYKDLIRNARQTHWDAGDSIQKLLERRRLNFHAIGSGNCILCSECAKLNNQPCRHPDQLRKSLSAYCIDVNRMAESCGLTFGDGVHTLTYFGIFCLEPQIESK